MIASYQIGRCSRTFFIGRHRYLSKKPGILQKALKGMKYLTGKIPPRQRELEELQELRLALLSIFYRQGKHLDPSNKQEDLMDSVWKENESLRNIGMRYEVQVELVPDILEIFDLFHQVDEEMDKVNQIEILREDYEKTLREGYRNPGNEAFFKTKRSALEILLNHFDPKAPIPEFVLPWDRDEASIEFQNLDAFGYAGKNVPKNVYQAIREQQCRNIVRSFLIKKRRGYSVLSLKSTIAEAGRGIFIDGSAPEGSILAFFPGKVWPREYFLDPAPDVSAYFARSQNPNFQVHFRGDDFIFDCRASPYTVLDNPWAIAHIANHAPISESNSRSICINIFEQMKLQDPLKKYIPNEYAKKPTLFGGKLLDRKSIEMHCMCLLSKRMILSNQEIFYDYRLPWKLENLPNWYRHVEYKLNSRIEQNT
jgi:hypothetical protein